MAAAPFFAGAIFDATAHSRGSLVFGMVLFAAVVPAAVAFRYFKAGGVFGTAVSMSKTKEVAE